ncbi:MAG: right-handed parallel beta-helix repeat-containing protein [Bryobacterales bacterium]|nr:right-handed parallel beta-helix repeat-containing protein [Bryobacterales bacterium]
MKLMVTLGMSASLMWAEFGPRTETPRALAGDRDIYVWAGAKGGTGERAKPFGTLMEAMEAAAGAKQGSRVRILVAMGRYRVVNVPLRAHVAIYGGFHPSKWQRDVAMHRSIFDANGEGRLFLCADDAELDGVTLQGGRVRGLGGAMLCEGKSPTLRNNVWERNETLGPQPWKPKLIHEDANDGGALACIQGCRAAIQRNLFYRNRTENGRGGALAITRSSPIVGRNVFLENDAGLADPMRSSDGGAVSVYDRAHPTILRNLVIANRALSKNDGGGVFVALWSAPRVEGNVFVENYADDDAGGLFVGGQKHHYDTPFDPMPPASEFQVSIRANRFAGNRNASMNSGAFRITMESRATFVNNVVAENQGAYFQRSEVDIAHNTFVDDVLITETKAGLRLPVLVNNILWKALRMDVDGRAEGNLSRAELTGANVRGEAGFVDDGPVVIAESATYRADIYATEVRMRESVAKSEWMDRPVLAGDRWTVVRSASGNVLSLWGDHSRVRSFRVQPSYAIDAKSAAVDRAVEGPRVETDIRGVPRKPGRADIGAFEWEAKK